MRCFGAQREGFFIDIGAGHPVYDNVAFAFYLQGWRGITVEPNPWLAQLTAAVRPHDRRIQALVGAAPGEATYYLVEDFHGLSTTVESNAQSALSEFGKRSQSMTVPVTTLATLCSEFAPGTIDFLKIDVEGAERDVLTGGDWTRFRPKVVLLEALAPVTLEPAWDAWEPLLLSQGYRFAFFDSLNRYYVAEEHAALAERLAAAPAAFPGIVPFRDFGRAADDPAHPDHALPRLLAGADMVRLPLMPPAEAARRLTAGLDAAALRREAGPAEIDAAHRRLFGAPPPGGWHAGLRLPPQATVSELYGRIPECDAFRAACGRISASYAW